MSATQTKIPEDSKSAVSVVPVSDAVGAEIKGIDIDRGLTDEEFGQVLQAWHDHSVLIFRGQSLSRSSFVQFSARFGTPEIAPPQESASHSTPEWPQIMIVSNVVENGKSIGHLGNKEAYWHTDMCFMTIPPISSLLYAVEIPPVGGDTGFMNMYRVYDRLPAKLKAAIAGLSIKHDRNYTAVGDLRHGCEPVTDISTSAGTIHPIVQCHPVTGRAFAYLGRRLNSCIVGLSLADSAALLDEIWGYTQDPSVIWYHKWKVGDVAMWDNRCLMHHRDAFDPNTRRVMWRTQIQANDKVRS